VAIVILLARQRSGTHALGSVLDRHPELGYGAEVFNPAKIDIEPNYFWYLKKILAEAPDLALPGNGKERLQRYLALLDQKAQKRLTVIDVKYSSTHHFNDSWHRLLARPVFLDLLRQFDLPVLHLTRRNHLRALISGVVAERTNIFHTDDVSRIRIEPRPVDAAWLLRALGEMDMESALIEQFLLPHRRLATLDYLDLFDENGLTAAAEGKICGLLDILPFDAKKPDIVKQAPDRFDDVIENYDEVEKLIRPTKYAWMLTEK
jgi:hypothetical protein